MNYYQQIGQVPYIQVNSNVREFYPKYKDFVWARDLQLERLTISKMILQDFVRNGIIVGRGFRDLDSAPLSGAPNVDLEANMEGITYQAAKHVDNIDPNASYDVTSR